MTTGIITTGLYERTTKLHYAKTWSGGDGHIILDRFTFKPKWNPYLMATCRFHSSNPNRLGVKDPFDGQVYLATNHSWNISTGPPEATGYAVAGDGSISNVFPTSQFNSLWTAREELALQSKLLAKVKGHSADLGVALAEVDKLAGTVLGTLKSIVYGVNDLKHFRFKKFARRFGARPPRKDRVQKLRTLDISGRFLEMRYAWEPTINDVFEAATAFEEITKGPRQQLFRAAKRKSLASYYNTNYCKVNQQVEVRRSYLFEMYEELGFARQLGLANPATILWERIPFSFVLDWFIPIGTYLSVLGQIPFMKGRWCRSSSIRWSTSGSYSASKLVSGWEPASPSVDSDWQRFNLERTITFEPPAVPFPNFRVHGAVQGKRIGNAIALAHQVIGGILGQNTGFVPLLF